jgi:glycosyltransferase involved in cell wall biosynthesis
MARRHVELCRRFPEPMSVSTVAAVGSEAFDSMEPYPITRRPFDFRGSSSFFNQVRWGSWLVARCRDDLDVLHCGNIRPVGYAVWWAHRRTHLPYLVYVNGGDLLRERQKATRAMKRLSARAIFERAAGIVGTSKWVADLATEVMEEVGVRSPPPVAAIDLGTDPDRFHPGRNGARMRAKWGIGDGPIILTVARLVPHKGQDMVIRALAELGDDFPEARAVLVGEGHDEGRLRALAAELAVQDRVHFAGPLNDEELPDAYAAATVYVGLSRVDRAINAEGFGISFLEASASGVPVIAGDSGGVRSAVRDGETGFVVPPNDVDAVVEKLGALLMEQELRRRMGEAGRAAVEHHYNWDRVAIETIRFTEDALARAQG